MNEFVEDNNVRYNTEILGITDTHIRVKMRTTDGFNAVCAGQPRNGVVVQGTNAYNVKLPGSFDQNDVVTLRRLR